jgi:Mn2+/Fe2+ NRAMP family transporter
MKKWGEVTLGVVTSIGGFLEVGSIATSVQGGAEFGYQLAWALVLGIAGLAFLMEMTGRLSAVSKRTYVDQLRERFGIRFFMAPLVALAALSLALFVAALPLQILGGR